jgi:hypothetical protein
VQVESQFFDEDVETLEITPDVFIEDQLSSDTCPELAGTVQSGSPQKLTSEKTTTIEDQEVI